MLFNLKREEKSKAEEKRVESQYTTINIPKEEEEFDYPKVVNLKDKIPFDVYIGRTNGEVGKWGNPFVIGKHGNREEVIALFEKYLLDTPELMEKVKTELKGKTLGCFCFPLACHGDVYLKYANPELYPETKKETPKFK